MYKLFREALLLFLTAIYINCRGESETQTVQTGETFSYSYPLEIGMLRITSEEYKHETKFKRWYLLDRVRYTYLVSVVKHIGDVKEVLEVFPMYMNCSRRFAGTTLPHREAMKERLHQYIQT